MKLRFALSSLAVTLVLYFLILARSTSEPGSQNFLQKQMEVTNKVEIIGDEFIQRPLAQNDPRVISYINNNGYLQPPSPVNVPYNLKKPSIDPSIGQSQIIKRIFNGKRNGFFVECGALDGEIRSNTLSLERDYGWQGLLIEGDPKNYQSLLSTNRKAWTSGSCLAIYPFPHEVMFKQGFNTGRINVDSIIGDSDTQESSVKVQCFPLFSLLSALKVKTVDYFSLDVEGFEMDVLRTIPFHLINIRVLSVEFVHGTGGPEELISFMRKKDYRVVTTLTHPNNLANDVIFAHKSFRVRAKFPEAMKSELMRHK